MKHIVILISWLVKECFYYMVQRIRWNMTRKRRQNCLFGGSNDDESLSPTILTWFSQVFTRITRIISFIRKTLKSVNLQKILSQTWRIFSWNGQEAVIIKIQHKWLTISLSAILTEKYKIDFNRINLMTWSRSQFSNTLMKAEISVY